MPDVRRSIVTDTRGADTRRRNNCAGTFGRSDHLTVGYGTPLQIRMVRGEGCPDALVLRGELDITSMGSFEEALAEVMVQRPSQMLFDLTECRFVSAQGYAAMGRCSVSTSVKVRSRTDIARRVFTILGYDRVVCVAP
jgi:anti-anti-sigma regulatory factor